MTTAPHIPLSLEFLLHKLFYIPELIIVTGMHQSLKILEELVDTLYNVQQYSVVTL